MPPGQKWMMDEIHTFWMKRLIWINFIMKWDIDQWISLTMYKVEC